MLFPTDPNKRPGLWDKFSEKVAEGRLKLLVHEGHAPMERGSLQSFKITWQVIDDFRSAALVRFGSSRGAAIGPFLAFSTEGVRAFLTEYAIDPLSQSGSGRAVQEDMQSAAINLFFERPDIEEIVLPFPLDKWESKEWEAVVEGDRTVLARRKTKE